MVFISSVAPFLFLSWQQLQRLAEPGAAVLLGERHRVELAAVLEPLAAPHLAHRGILGAERAVEVTERLAATYGDRFTPPALLREMAEKGESFYGRFGGQKQAA